MNARSTLLPPSLRHGGLGLIAVALGLLAPSCKDGGPKAAVCGNGVLETNEECEGSPPPDGCTESCTAAPGWACDPPTGTEGGSGGPVGMEVQSTCTQLEGCGNGAIEEGEICDDANTAEGDGCFGCQIEDHWQCAGEPSLCAECGDAIVDPTLEACDNGGGPGCTSSCQLVTGWACEGQPSLCTPVCGDGIWIGEGTLGVTPAFAEGCDDGNLDPGDGCDGSCDVEPGCSCGAQPTETSACSCPGDTTSDSGPADGTSTGDATTGGSESGSSSESGGSGSGSTGTGTTTGG